MTKGDAPPSGLSPEEAQAAAGSVALLLITAAWWALALWPVDDAPAWLERTRFVCFNVTESGLPDAGGWIGLIGGPLGMGVILATGWSAGFSELLARARRSGAVAVSFAAVVAGFVLLMAGAAWRVQDARAAVPRAELPGGLAPEDYPRGDRPAPPLGLTSQLGTELTLEDLRGRPVLVTFAFAHCQTICPLVVRDALAAREALHGTAVEPAVLVVTVDPWRDTPSRLPAMAEEWQLPDDGAWVLSGEVDAVQQVLDAWQVPRDRVEATGEIIHPPLTYVLDGEGRMAFASTGRADALIALLRRL